MNNNGKTRPEVQVVILLVIIVVMILASALLMGKARSILDNESSKPKKTNERIEYTLSNGDTISRNTRDFNILMSSENKDLEGLIKSGLYSKNYNINIDYADTFETMDILNSGAKYDALFVSNSIWQYMLNSNVSFKNAKSTSITPIAFGIKKSKAESLGFTSGKVYTRDIIQAIKDGNLKFTMSNPSTTNSGASAYFALLYTLADYPVVLTEEHLQDETLQNEIKEFFMGQQRTIGDEDFLQEAFLNGDYEAVVSYEYSIININKELEKRGEEPLYLVYPYDGVAICDNVFGYIDNKDEDKLEMFNEIQDYLLSPEAKEKLASLGRRTWYGGISSQVDKNVFNPLWGIDTTKFINSVKFPTRDVIKLALYTYQEQFRKPIHVVFCLDYSGSMIGEGREQLFNAMDYILTEKAKEDNLQFGMKDKIDIVKFEYDAKLIASTQDGTQTSYLLDAIKREESIGATALYDAAIKGIELLKDEDKDQYNLSVILMTDGEGNRGSYSDLNDAYDRIKMEIPIYSIMFGDARRDQLDTIARLTNGKVFDGKNDLVAAFKAVRGFN